MSEATPPSSASESVPSTDDAPASAGPAAPKEPVSPTGAGQRPWRVSSPVQDRIKGRTYRGEPPVDRRAWYRKKRYLIPLVAAALVALFSSCLDRDQAAESPTPVTPVTTVTATVVIPPGQAPAGDGAPQVTPDGGQPPQGRATFTMPQLVGMTLQDAQDHLQGLGSYWLHQRDATGQNRLLINDRNWQVCSQSPAAGAQASASTLVELSSVKRDESCP